MTIGARVKEAREQADLSVRELAQDIGLGVSTLYDLERGDQDSTAKLGAIAERLGVRVKWLETGTLPKYAKSDLHEAGSASGTQLRQLASSRPGVKVINIPQLDVHASMGTGVDLQEHVEVVRMIQVNLPDLRRVLPSFTAPENLVIITGLGDSMRGTFNDGDPIIVDQGVKEVTVEGIYVLRREGELFIKRLQRQLDGTLMMISDNPRYPPQHITDDTRKSFDVVGRALGVWNFQKF